MALNPTITDWRGKRLCLAGDYVPMRADTFNLATAERVLDANFHGALRLLDCARHDLPPGGGIAFVASVAGYRGLPQALCYGPGKVARAIVDGLGMGKFEIHFPRRFSGWLKCMALLPYRWYFPLVRHLTGG